MLTISATYEPDDHERDDADGTGLTAEAHDRLLDALMELGFADIEIRRK